MKLALGQDLPLAGTGLAVDAGLKSGDAGADLSGLGRAGVASEVTVFIQLAVAVVVVPVTDVEGARLHGGAGRVQGDRIAGDDARQDTRTGEEVAAPADGEVLVDGTVAVIVQAVAQLSHGHDGMDAARLGAGGIRADLEPRRAETHADDRPIRAGWVAAGRAEPVDVSVAVIVQIVAALNARRGGYARAVCEAVAHADDEPRLSALAPPRDAGHPQAEALVLGPVCVVVDAVAELGWPGVRPGVHRDIGAGRGEVETEIVDRHRPVRA